MWYVAVYPSGSLVLILVQYLAFFKMAIKFLLVALFFALAVIKPVHDTHQEKKIPSDGHEKHDKRDDLSILLAMATDYEAYTD